MSKPRTLAARLVISVFVLASLGWVLHTPSDPRVLLQALPGHVTAVTRHRDLPSRIPGLLENPGVESILFEAGLDPEGVGRLAARGDVQRVLHHLAGREVVTATMGAQPGAPWFVVSQVGWKSIPLRWILSLVRFSSIRELNRFQGYHVWRVERGTGAQSVVFTFHHGLFIAARGPEPAALHLALSALDGVVPSARSLGIADALPWDAPDAAWIQVLRPGQVRASGVSALSVALDRLDARHTRGWVETPDDEVPPFGPGLGPDPAFLHRLFRAHPLAMGRMPPEVLTGLLPDLGLPALPPAWERLVNGFSGRAAGVAVFSGPHSGRLSGVRVPALAAVVPFPSEEGVARVMEIIAQIRVAEDWAIEPRLEPVGEVPVIVLDPTSADRYASEVEPGHRLAFALLDDHLVFVTSRQVLSLLLAGATSAGEPPPPVPWLDLATSEATPAAMWMDAEQLGGRLAPLLTLYSVGQATGGVPGGRRVGAGVAMAQNLLAFLEPMGQVDVQLAFTPHRARFTFQAGQEGSP